jgi:hypothetical protein
MAAAAAVNDAQTTICQPLTSNSKLHSQAQALVGEGTVTEILLLGNGTDATLNHTTHVCVDWNAWEP